MSAPYCADPAENCAESAANLPDFAQSDPEEGRKPFRWTRSAQKAAVLLGEDQISDAAIALECKVARRTLTYWKTRKEFRERIEQHKRLTAKDAMFYSIARKIERVRALDERWAKMHAVINERAADMAEVPGGSSGLLTREVKGIGAGDNFREVEEYKVDTGLLKELREHERQAAIEVGQWQESGSTGSALKPGEQRVTITYDMIQEIRTREPERWARIERMAEAARELPAASEVIDVEAEK